MAAVKKPIEVSSRLKGQIKFVPDDKPAARDHGAPHYKNMGIEPWDVIDTWSFEERVGYYRGNLLKYTMRMGSKDACSSDIAKAEHYSQKLQEVLAEQNL